MKHFLLNTLVIVTMMFQLFPGDPASAKQAPSGTGSLSQSAPQTGITPPVINSSDETGMVTFIGSADGTPIPVPSAHLTTLDSSEKASRVLQVYAPKFGINDPQQELILIKNEITERDRNSLRYQQVYQGIPVMAGEIILNLSSTGDLYSMSGEVSPYLDLSTIPAISAGQASSQALELMTSRYGVEQNRIILTEPELWIFDERLLLASTKPVELVWRMEARTTDGSPLDVLILVNAVRGGISLQFNQVDTDVTGRTWLPGERQQEIPPTDVPTETPVPTETGELTVTPLPTETTIQDPGQVEPESTVEIEAVTTWYVATTGSNTNDCRSVTTPCATIQAAVDKAASGDTIKITAETYTTSDTTSESIVNINRDLNLIGGWDSSFSNRAGMTKLDGMQNWRGIKITKGSTAPSVILENIEIMNGLVTKTDGNKNGGGIWMSNVLNVTIINSSIHNNYGMYGGGIYSYQGIQLTIINSTIGENSATNIGNANPAGGGIYASFTEHISLRNVTIAKNTSTNKGGGVYFYGGNSNSLDFQNSIIAGNSALDSPDCWWNYQTRTSNGYNLIQNTGGCRFTTSTGDILNQDAGLGSILPSGVFYFNPLSPAVDNGNPLMPGSGGAACEATDQLGKNRPLDGNGDSTVMCDIGAAELEYKGSPTSYEVQVSSGSPQNIILSSQSSVPLVAKVTDQYGGPSVGEIVTFTAPSSGASGVFLDSISNVTTAISNAAGLASASLFSANSIEGSYLVGASFPGTSSMAQFQIRNYAPIPTFIEIISGSNQSTEINNTFSLPFIVIVKDQYEVPYPGATVTFTAPPNGTSGTFTDTENNSTTSVTGPNGISISSAFRANGIPGYFSITASVPGISTSVDFQLRTRDFWYVSSIGNDTNDCVSVAYSCKTIQAALDKALSGDTIYISAESFTGSLDSILTISKDVNLVGGWDSTFTTRVGMTTLDGGMTRRGIDVIKGNTVVLKNFEIKNGLAPSSAPNGGAIHQQMDSNLTIINSSIHHNSANYGGAIYSSSADSLNIINSTIGENIADFDGGGIKIIRTTQVNLRNVTIHNNSSGRQAGGIEFGHDDAGQIIRIQNSIISKNTSPLYPDCWRYSGGVISTGYNLIQDPTECRFSSSTGDVLGQDAKLGPLMVAGVYFISPLSPAIDAGNPLTPGSGGGACEASDQLETPRPVDGNFDLTSTCDMGAYESDFPLYTPIATTLEIASGSAQIVQINRQYQPLSVLVRDQYGVPLTDASVTFSAPASGAGGVFGDTGANVLTLATNSSGLASASPFTANLIPGSFTVQATVSGIGSAVNFQLQNRDYWYVSTTGNDANDCNTPTTPCASLQAGMDKTVAGDTILVAIGNYAGANVNRSMTVRGGWNPTFISQTGMSTLDGGIGMGYNFAVLNIVPTSEIVDIQKIKIQGGNYGVHAWARTLTTIRQSLITGNQTGLKTLGSVNLVNTTISGNSGISGCGIEVILGPVMINNSTITNNFKGATATGCGIYTISASPPVSIMIQNSIISGNTAGWNGPNCYGYFSSGGHNIIGSGCTGFTALPSDQIGIDDPGLTPLLAGGYQMPLPGSPAIDGGSPDVPGSLGTACEAIDQNGMSRPVDGNGDGTSICDIGAVEFTGGGTVPSGLYPFAGLSRYDVPSQLMPIPFGAAIVDADGKGVAGVDVTLTAPLSGPSGTFSATGTNTVTIQTNNVGLAIAGDFIANNQIGSYSVMATATGLEDHFSYTVTNGVKISTYTMNHQEDPPGTLPGTFVCDETDPGCTNKDDLDADHAQAFTIDTYSFYMQHHLRNSLDNYGMPIINSVHYGTDFQNSFWDGSQAVFGDNEPTDDTVGHELTHGVTEFTSGLFYYYQSGAINESFSDLWGEFIDQTNGKGADFSSVRWLLGEESVVYRNMANPSAFDQPDEMTDGNYHRGDLRDKLLFPFDNGGVHTNSGVNNKAVFLMTDGGTFNGIAINGLGLNKVVAVYYEAQTHLLTSGSDYLDLYYVLQQACVNLISGKEGITLADCGEVKNALDAVQMNMEPYTGFMPEAQLCDSGLVPKNLFFDDFENPNTLWNFNNHTPADILWGRTTGYAAGGLYSLYGIDPDVTSDISATMAAGVIIPQYGSTYLYFQHAFGFEYSPSSSGEYQSWDGGVLDYKVDAGAWQDARFLWDSGQGYNGTVVNYVGDTNPLAGKDAFVRDSHGYVSSRYNLGTTALQGHSLKFRWRIGSDATVGNLGWVVDNVRIYTCQAPVPTFNLNVSKTGTGIGTITSSPPGINCGSTCSYSFDNNSNVTLTATASAGSAFTGWSGGGCSGTGTCTITIKAATSVTAAFELLPGAFNKSSPTTATTNQPLNVTLNWEPSAGAASYSYCYDTTNDNACTNWVNNGTATSKALSGLAQNTTYYWQVRAANAAGLTYANGSATAYWNFKTGALPGAFLKTSPTNGATNQSVNPTLKWAASTGAAYYEYCYDTTNDNTCTNWVNNGTSTSVVLTNLVPGTIHYWQVRAVSAVGMTYANGSATAFWNFKTGALPGTFNKSNPANGAIDQPATVTLSWTASSAATSYWYCYDTSNDNACTTWITNGTATSKALSGLAANTTYYWHVRADNTIGSTYSNGSSTAFWSFSTGNFVALPGAFNKIAPTTGTTGSPTNPTLSWGASPGATSYSYCYDKTNDTACTSWINNGTSTSVTLSGLSASTTYYWHVRATNSAGTTYSNASSTAFWNFKTGTLPAAFVKSSPASGSTNKPLSLTLKWLSSSGATSYWVCYDTSNDNACSNWVNNGTALSMTISALSPSTTYYWHVRADNAIGSTYSNSSSTAFWKFTTGAGGGTLPGAFNKSSPTNGATGQPLSLTLSWGASSGATSYWYCYDTTNDNACTSWVNNGTATSATINSLAPSTTYYWHVRADNVSGSTYSNASSTAFWSFTTGTGGGALPGAFYKLSPAKWATGMPTTVTLSWGASSGATSYQYCYDTTNDNACTYWFDIGNSTSVLISSLSANTAYYWHVRAVNAFGTTYSNGTSTSFWKFTTVQ